MDAQNKIIKVPGIIQPTADEIETTLKKIVNHTIQVEYYIMHVSDALGLPYTGKSLVCRPHDMSGPYNKFELPIFTGLALGLRYAPKDPEFQTEVFPALKLHLLHEHHQRWNNPNPEAGDHDLMLGAVDAVVTRLYGISNNGEPHTFDEIEASVQRDTANLKYQSEWMGKVIGPMRELGKLELPKIHSFADLSRTHNATDNHGNHMISLEMLTRILAYVASAAEFFDDRGYRLSNWRP